MRAAKNVIAVLGFSVASCSLVTDLTGLSTGDGSDAAPADSAAQDGGNEGSSDARSTSDGGLVRCADRSPQPVFCTDFDDATSLGDLFDNHSATSLGEGVRDALAKSGPSSLLLRQTKTFTGTCGYLEYWRDVGGPNAIVLETWVRLGDAAGAYPTDGVFASISHRAVDGTSGCTQILRTDGDSSRTLLQSQRNLPGGGTDDDNYTFSRPLLPGTWTLLRVDLTLDTATGGTRAVIRLDGQTVIDQGLAACRLGTASVRVGMYCERRVTREMRFDDLVIDAR